MSAILEIINLATTITNDFKVLLVQMYNLCGSKLNISFEELRRDSSRHLQAHLFNVANADKDVSASELEMLHTIASDDDLFERLNFLDYNSFNETKKQELIELCKKIISEVPYAVKLACLCDKKYDEELKSISPTFSQVLFDYIKRVNTYIEFVDGSSEEVERTSAREDLNVIIAYFKKQRVKYAPERNQNSDDEDGE